MRAAWRCGSACAWSAASPTAALRKSWRRAPRFWQRCRWRGRGPCACRANGSAAKIVAARADQVFGSVDDVWRRAGVPSASLVQLAEADAFRPALGLDRREALWAIKALRDEPLPLFAAAAARADEPVAEIAEPQVVLKPMTAGSEVVEDY